MVDQLTHALVTSRSTVSREAAIDEITDAALRYLLKDGSPRDGALNGA